jgi:uncharacterized protein (DUF1800 family)
MMRRLLVFLPWLLAGPGSAQAPLSPADSARHVLNRLAFGPRPGDIAAVTRIGALAWADQQLATRRPDDAALRQADGLFDHSRFAAERLLRQPKEMRKERRTDLLAFQQLTMARAVLAEDQLREVLVDFWTNHFNVFLNKGEDRALLPEYIERVIRPNALGKFRVLLLATARSPAMLFYLDNARNGRRGINENYARELMELHTLGVDGGYTQKDVTEVARILTGWGINPRERDQFEFHPRAHDDGAKTVLGVAFPAGGGMREGERLIAMLAAQPATMHFVSQKLCARFVMDEAPDGCTDDAVRAWKASDGDILAIMRAIVHSQDFWSPRAAGSKVKSPLEFVVSAARSLGMQPDTTPRLAQAVARLGQPLFQYSAPTGYPEKEQEWVNSGALLARMNFAVALAGGMGNGENGGTGGLDQIDRDLFAGRMSETTRKAIQREITESPNPQAARRLAIGLALGSPEFQRQ